MRAQPVLLPTVALTTLLILAPALAAAQTATDDGAFTDLQRTRQLLLDLESRNGNHDLSLAEPLAQLAADYMALGRYAEAHDAVDRAMQIVRVNQGLYTRAQIPYLKTKIDNYTRWRDWDAARTQLQHLFWLYRTKSPHIDERLITDLMDLSAMHLRGVSEDSLEHQIYHMHRAASSNWLALAAGEALWGARDSRLAPILYSLVKQYHIQAAAVEQGGSVAYALREIVPGSDLTRDRADTRNFYYFTGMRLLKQLRAIYAEAEPINGEGLAMADLYLADWQMLFSRQDDALENYALAFSGLEAAGVEQAQLERFFDSPTLLPAPEFHASLDAALAARNDLAMGQRQEEEGINTLYFAEWSSSIPYVQRPTQPYVQQALDSNIALFSFNVAGVTELSHWINGRREKTRFAFIEQARLVRPEPYSEDQAERLLERLEWLTFRPRLDRGQPQPADATLMYQLAGDLP